MQIRTNYQQFARQINNLKKRQKDIALDAKREIVSELFRNLVEGTPRDTGRAQASWRAANGSPDPTFEPDNKKSYRASRKIPVAVLRGMNLEVPTFVTNGVPYIGRLANGWSKQAPRGWVARAVAAANSSSRIGKIFRR